MKTLKIITSLILITVMALVICACGGEKEMENTFVKITMEDDREIILETLPEYAPMSVEFFLELVEEEYYDGLTFHRAVEGFMIQGGSPNGDGIGGCGRTVKGEFASNGIENNLSHERGVVSFARTQVRDSASGQFFIMHDDGDFLDGEYAAFGRVVEGMEVVDAFLEVERVGREGGTPTEPITMEKVTVIED